MNKKIYQICNVVLAVTLSLTSASCSYLDVTGDCGLEQCDA